MMEYERRNINSNCNNAVDSLTFPSTVAAPNKSCHGCKNPIEDEFSLHVSPNLEWHVACLVCCECHEFLDESCDTCFIKDGRPYCRSDYVRIFGMQCAKCSQSINSNTLVMRAGGQIFHIDCFRCETCNKKLETGEEFGMIESKLYCKKDFEMVSHDNLIESLEDLEASIPISEPLTTTSTTTFAQSITDCSSDAANPTSSTSLMTNSKAMPLKPTVSEKPSRRSSPDSKTPRIRTVLTEHQLQTLRSVYQSNPRPDALLKEQLCELTGLSPRVIRVWFQNRRCKDKKKALQQAEVARLQAGNKILQMPMTPQTPITPDGMSQVSPRGSMQAFTYPLPTYDQVTTSGLPPTPLPPTPLPPTPSHTCVSPNISFPNHHLWHHSPTETACTFEHSVDFTSSLQHTTDNQTFIYTTPSQSHLPPQPTTVTPDFQYC